MSILVIRDGYNSGATFRLGKRSLTIGRDPGNLIQLIDDKVSRRHVMLAWEHDGYVVTDLQSHNGVYINGQRIKSQKLCPRDTLLVGSTAMELVPEQDISRDETLSRKVVDQRMTGGATQTVKSRHSIQNSIDAGELVNLDECHSYAAIERQSLLWNLKSAIKKQRPPAEVFAGTCTLILKSLGPDRVLILKATPEGKAVPVKAGFASDLATIRQRRPAHMKGLVYAIRTRTPLVLNQIPVQAGDQLPLGTMLAAPIVNDNVVVGAIYVDSFADNHQAYVDDDASFLDEIATLLSPFLKI
jgi:pSer/pThr/pTyr-binding forkhead associated (FHA) protein